MKHSFRNLVFFLLVAICGLGCSPKKPQATNEPSPSPTESTPIATAPVDYVASSLQAGQKAQKDLELMALRKAIESFQQEEGRLPTSLQELVEKSYLKAMPPLPPGSKLAYNPQDGSVQFTPISPN